jgi:hypothetical protein
MHALSFTLRTHTLVFTLRIHTLSITHRMHTLFHSKNTQSPPHFMNAHSQLHSMNAHSQLQSTPFIFTQNKRICLCMGLAGQARFGQWMQENTWSLANSVGNCWRRLGWNLPEIKSHDPTFPRRGRYSGSSACDSFKTRPPSRWQSGLR